MIVLFQMEYVNSSSASKNHLPKSIITLNQVSARKHAQNFIIRIQLCLFVFQLIHVCECNSKKMIIIIIIKTVLIKCYNSQNRLRYETCQVPYPANCDFTKCSAYHLYT